MSDHLSPPQEYPSGHNSSPSHHITSDAASSSSTQQRMLGTKWTQETVTRIRFVHADLGAWTWIDPLTVPDHWELFSENGRIRFWNPLTDNIVAEEDEVAVEIEREREIGEYVAEGTISAAEELERQASPALEIGNAEAQPFESAVLVGRKEEKKGPMQTESLHPFARQKHGGKAQKGGKKKKK
ncbi:Hypothetical predicted protein [Lecanosticta acicola]|uniref:Uncharacterized protein n=1 Tax=Lecanosticta acicola TaxID=111012 RepID=A0AAI8Z7B5_9PEZI|nr:Hypothetical predicted protein [Lecanosticta acicola]